MTIQRRFSWRGANWCGRSYSGTPQSLTTLDQNGRDFCLFFFFARPCLISCKFEPLSRPIKLHHTCASFRARSAACHHVVRPLSSAVKFVTCCHCTSWTPKPATRRGGYNRCGDAEKELNSLRCCAGGSGRAWRKCRQDERSKTASAPSQRAGQVCP